MNNSGRAVTKKLIGFLIAGYLCGILVFTVISIITFPEDTVHRTFMVPWILDNSINTFINYCISIHATVVLFVFSMVLPAGKFHQIDTGTDSFFSVLSSALLIFVIFTLVFALLTEMVQPGINKRKQAMVQKTEMMRSFTARARYNFREGDFEEAERYIEYYMRFDKNNRDMGRMLQNIHERNRYVEEEGETAGTEQSISRSMDRSPAELIETARIYFDQEDYLSAHYYAMLAYEIDGTRTEAKELADRAWSELKKAGIDARTRAEALLFSKKQEAFTALKQGDPVRAYYLFLSLKNRYPHDADIKKYFQESLQKVEKAAFFKREVEIVEAIPGFTAIFFVNKREKEMIEFVSIPHLVPKDGTLYVEDIEVLGVNPGSGELLYHYRAPYGKLQEGEVLLRCIEKEREKVYLPVSLMREEDGKKNQNDEIIPFSITLEPPVEMLRYLNPENTGKEMNIAVLWDSTELFSQYGYPQAPLQQEFFYRIVRIFTFFTASLFACFLGWNLRVVGKGVPLIPVLFIPLFPLALNRLFSLYFWFVSTIVGFVLVLSDFILALLFLFGTQAVIMLIIILLFARQYKKRM